PPQGKSTSWTRAVASRRWPGVASATRRDQRPQLVGDERQVLSISPAVQPRRRGGRSHWAYGPVYRLLAAEPQGNEGDPALPPLGGYQELNDVSFLAARSIAGGRARRLNGIRK